MRNSPKYGKAFFNVRVNCCFNSFMAKRDFLIIGNEKVFGNGQLIECRRTLARNFFKCIEPFKFSQKGADDIATFFQITVNVGDDHTYEMWQAIIANGIPLNTFISYGWFSNVTPPA